MGFRKIASRIRTFLMGMVVLQGVSLTAHAQFVGPPQQLYAPGTSWLRIRNTDGNCLFYGQQPQRSTVYAWEDGCSNRIKAWGYAFDYPVRLDSVVWVNNTQSCGNYSRAWQWYDDGFIAENVAIRNGFACTFDYYSGSSRPIEVPRPKQQSLWIYPSAGCAPNLIALSVRKDLAYSHYLNQILIAPYTNPHEVEKAWHAYNRASLTFSACQRQLGAYGTDQYQQQVIP